MTNIQNDLLRYFCILQLVITYLLFMWMQVCF